MQLEDLLIQEDKRTYKCFAKLKQLIKENDSFREILLEGYREHMITGFDEDIWNKIRSQNIRRIDTFERVFIEGANIGYCTVASKQLSYSFNGCYICGGVLPLLENSENCIDGSHTWLYCDGKIIDTTLMLIISKEYQTKLGYIEQNRYNPSCDPIYVATKDYTVDSNLCKTR